ncbi:MULTISPECIES: PAS domain-containing protein [Rhizobium/Agrobacterium group]|uniref:PAS domain-containing protein n=1 Tax=Rhizobium/Agrobacterium group TaxID=227290 RepID=UPI0025700FC4|nr:PAS domain-containing protein [Agrobacterium sp. Ap1]
MTERQANLDYKQLFDDAPCGYLLVAPDGVIIQANNWISSLLGYPSGGIDGKRLRDILSIAARILYETNLALLLRLQQGVSEVTIDLKRRDGKAIPVIMSASQTLIRPVYLTRRVLRLCWLPSAGCMNESWSASETVPKRDFGRNRRMGFFGSSL